MRPDGSLSAWRMGNWCCASSFALAALYLSQTSRTLHCWKAACVVFGSRSPYSFSDLQYQHALRLDVLFGDARPSVPTILDPLCDDKQQCDMARRRIATFFGDGYERCVPHVLCGRRACTGVVIGEGQDHSSHMRHSSHQQRRASGGQGAPAGS